MLTTTGRRVRTAAAAAVVLLLVWGTFWGEDDHWPFGPFRMYSVRNDLDGEVRSLELEGVDAAGRRFDVRTELVGLRRADIEGQLGKLERPPEVVAGLLARAYERLHPDEPPLVELRLYERIFRMRAGRPVSEDEETITTWRRG